MHGWTWSIIAQYLADQFHCWALDFRGHGESAVAVNDDMHFEGFGREYLAVVDAMVAQAITTARAAGVGGLI
jgi:pimeloyl-ACP methyl ester carboxylesterase